MKVDVLDIEGKKIDTAELPSAVFEAPIRSDLMHQALVRQMANARLGTHKTKTRSEVRGGGRKPWRQKGTGRARHGSRRSPIWVGGGGVHTPQPRDYSKKMPRKMRRAALRSALSVKSASKDILVLDAIQLDEAKTKAMANILDQLVGSSSALIVLADRNETVEKAVRNLNSAKTLQAGYMNVRDLLGYDRLILSKESIEAIEGYLGTRGGAA